MSPALRISGAASAAAIVLLAGCALNPEDEAPWADDLPSVTELRQYTTTAVEFTDQGVQAHRAAYQRARQEALAAADEAREFEDLYLPLHEAAAAAGGPHSYLSVPANVPPERPQPPTGPTAEISHRDGVTTFVLPAIDPADRVPQETYARTLREGFTYNEACGYIVDLRQTGLWGYVAMLAGLGPLLPTGTALSITGEEEEIATIDVLQDGATDSQLTIAVGVLPSASHSDKPVAILQGPDTSAGGEVTLAAFTARDDVATFGAETAGEAAGNQALLLPDGAAITLTLGTLKDAEGQEVSATPLQPDHHTSGVEVEQEARQWLADQGCGPR